MSEPRIGRVLVASLHQSIADLLPTRLEFYEAVATAHQAQAELQRAIASDAVSPGQENLR